MRVVLSLSAALLLSGCVSPQAVLVNDEGQTVTCEAKGFGLISGTMANNRYQECVSEAQMRGYRVVESEE